MTVRQDQRYPGPKSVKVGQIVSEVLSRDLITRSIGTYSTNLRYLRLAFQLINHITLLNKQQVVYLVVSVLEFGAIWR